MSGTSADDDRLIAAYRDGTLDGAGTADFEQRLVGEPALARRLAAHLLLEVDLHALARQEPPPTAAPAPAVTTRRIATARRVRRRARALAWWPAAAAAAALVAAIALAWPAPAPLVEVLPSPAATVDIDGRLSAGGAFALRPGQRLRTTAVVTLRWRGEATTAELMPTTGAAEARLVGDGLELEAGAIEAEVAPRGADRRFRVIVGEAQAIVIGTRFRVERQGARTLLAVASGRVELRRGASSDIVTTGQRAVADAQGVRPLAEPAPATAPAVDVDRGLLARWSGDGLVGGRLGDLGPGGHHGQASGVRAVAGRRGQALAFAGEASTVTIPAAPALEIGDPAQPFTIALWLRQAAGVARGEQTLVAKGRNAAQPAPTLAICLAISGGDRLDIYRWHDGPALGATKMEASGWRVAPFADGAWHHLAVVCEHATLRRCYRDGIEVGTDTTPWRNDTRNRSRWSLGRLENMGFTGEMPFTGELEDVRLYGRVLTAAEVGALAR